MFLPLSTEHEVKCKPIANLSIIAITALVSWSLFNEPITCAGLPSFVLARDGFRLEQLLGHLFTHADPGHLIGNMALLLVIGNPVNRRLGNLRYTALYLIMGIVAGLAWLALGKGIGAIGASGAVMGMVGMFLVLFPTNRIKGVLSWAGLGLVGLTVLWWATGMASGITFLFAFLVFYGVGALVLISRSFAESEVSAGNILLTLLGLRLVHLTGIWLVLLTLGFDIAYLLSNVSDGVAHISHVAGAFAGFGLGVSLCYFGSVRGNTSEPTLVELIGLVETLPDTRTPVASSSAPANHQALPGVGPLLPRSRPRRLSRLHGRRPDARRVMSFEQWAAENRRTERINGTGRDALRPSRVDAA